MAKLVEQKATLFQLRFHGYCVCPRILDAVRFGFQIWVSLMLVPSVQKRKRDLELQEKAIVSDFREPVNEVQDILAGVGPFDAHAAVAEAGALFIRCGEGLGGNSGNDFTIRSRGKEPAPQPVEIVIHAQQYAAVVDAADLAAVRRDPDRECIQGLPAGHSEAKGKLRRGGEHFCQILFKLRCGKPHGLGCRGIEGDLHVERTSISDVGE